MIILTKEEMIILNAFIKAREKWIDIYGFLK